MQHKSIVFMLCAVIFATCALSNISHAGIISGTHYTSDNHQVNLQALEWLTWDETMGISRQSIESGYGDYFDNGWRYATKLEFARLLQSIAPVNTLHADNDAGLNWLWENFDNPHFERNFGPQGEFYSRLGDLFIGADGECLPSTNYSCIGHIRAYDSQQGWVHDQYGYNPELSFHHRLKTDAFVYEHYALASVLVKEVALENIPEPTTISLFAFALLGFVYRATKQN